MVPVRLGLHADPVDGDGLALDAEQPLDDELRLLVASFAEVLVADDPVRVDEVERRPVVVVEGAPDLVVAVEHDRVVDPSRLRRAPHAIDFLLERELRGVDSDDDQSVASVGLRPGTDVRLLAQPVDACQRPEVDEDDVAAQVGGAEWLGVQPRGRSIETWDVGLGSQRLVACAEQTHLALPTSRTAAANASGASCGRLWPTPPSMVRWE